jgi:outer membrane lipoprotein SlyB
MKKITYICALSILSLIGCTSTSTTDTASQAKQEHIQNAIQLNSVNIADIEH